MLKSGKTLSLSQQHFTGGSGVDLSSGVCSKQTQRSGFTPGIKKQGWGIAKTEIIQTLVLFLKLGMVAHANNLNT